MEETLDIFRTDDFRATTMTEMVGDIDTVPTYLDDLGIFEADSIRTTTVTLKARNGHLTRVATSERGAPEQVPDRKDWTVRQIEAPRLAQRDRINASEVQNLLNPYLPKEMRLQNANELVAERFQDLKDNDANTKEAHRFGALQGQVLDADGTRVVSDFYEEFGFVKPAAVPLDITATPARELRGVIEDSVVMPMKKALRGRWTPRTQIHALASNGFWGKLRDAEATQRVFELAAAYDQTRKLAEGTIGGTIEFGGVVWHHYLGDDAETLQVPDGDAIFFPKGAKDMFKVYYTPGESFEEVNAKNKEVYGIVSPDNRQNMNEWVDVYVRSYPLFACLCPQALMTARVS